MKLFCKLFGHSWSLYMGYNKVRPHPSAYCLKCDVKVKDLK